MARKKLTFLVENNLPSCFEETLHKFCVSFSENGRHHYIDGVSNNFIFIVSKYLSQAFACIHDLSKSFFVTTYMHNSRVIAKKCLCTCLMVF